MHWCWMKTDLTDEFLSIPFCLSFSSPSMQQSTWMQNSFVSFWLLICSSLTNTIPWAAAVLCSFLYFHDVLPQCKAMTFETIKLPFLFCGHEVLRADEIRTPPCYARTNTDCSTVIFYLENYNVATAWFSPSIPFILQHLKALILHMLQWKQQDVFFFISFSKEGISSMKPNWSWKKKFLKIGE